MPTRAFVFDVGGVLLDWNPRYLYRKIFQGQEIEMEWFLSHVCTQAWNERHDTGVSYEENRASLVAQYPQYECEIRVFEERWSEMVKGAIAGTVDILREVKEHKYPLYVLSNFSKEKFPYVRKHFSFFRCFDGFVVSGELGMKKPDPAIFRYLVDKYSLIPQETVFIDDVVENIQASQQLGFQAIWFQGPKQLRRELTMLGVL